MQYRIIPHSKINQIAESEQCEPPLQLRSVEQLQERYIQRKKRWVVKRSTKLSQPQPITSLREVNKKSLFQGCESQYIFRTSTHLAPTFIPAKVSVFTSLLELVTFLLAHLQNSNYNVFLLPIQSQFSLHNKKCKPAIHSLYDKQLCYEQL